MIPVKDHKNLYRDEKSGAILNTDTDGFNPVSYTHLRAHET